MRNMCIYFLEKCGEYCICKFKSLGETNIEIVLEKSTIQNIVCEEFNQK